MCLQKKLKIHWLKYLNYIEVRRQHLKLKNFFLLLCIPFFLFGKMELQSIPPPQTVSKLSPLRVGAVMPDGWIREQLYNDVNSGIAAYFLKLRPKLGINTYLKKNARLGVGEMTGNWADGYIRMAYLSGSLKAKRRADNFVASVLKTRDIDGYLGNVNRELRYQNALTGELWTQSRLYVALLAYYELTGKKEVLDAVIRTTQLTMSKYHSGNLPFHRTPHQEKIAKKNIVQTHGLMFVDVLEWLYRITGDKVYVDFAKFLYDDFSSTKNVDDPDIQLTHLLTSEYPFFWHGVHTVEQIRVPAFLKYARPEELKYGKASDNAFKKLFKHIVPSGSITSAEGIYNTIPPAKTYYEYCVTTELSATLESVLAKSGNMSYADKIEINMFNAAQGSRTTDGKNISYLTADTRITATKDHDFPYTGKGRCQLSPAHRVGGACCSANSVKILPYYVNSMWMRSKDEGLTAVLFGPCSIRTSVKKIPVSIKEETNYPFDDQIIFTFTSKESVSFPLTIRIPEWSGKVNLKASGAKVEKYHDRYIVQKIWKKGDKVTLKFENPIRLKYLADGTVSIFRGPLLFVQSWRYKKVQLPRKFSVPNFHEYNLFGNPKYDNSISYVDIKAKNFGIEVKHRQKGDFMHPWAKPPLILDANLKSASRKNNFKKNYDLVPIGSALIRFSSFGIWPFNDGYVKDILEIE